MTKFEKIALIFISRAYFFSRGRGRLVFMNPWKRMMDSFGHQSLRMKSRNGDVIYAYADDFIGRMLYYFGELDPLISQVCRQLIRPGDTVLDVGANVGIVAILASRLTGPTGRVHAFEPQPELIKLLKLSAQENGFSWLDINACGVSESNGKMILRIPANNYGEASFDGFAGDGTDVETRMCSLDSFATERSLSTIRLMKVDVQGHEASVFIGAQKLLAQNPPDFILFESYYERLTPLFERKPVRILRDHGYRVYDLISGLMTVHFVPCNENSSKFPRSFDLLAVREGMEFNH